MKRKLLLLFIISQSAWALRTESIVGYGSSSGYCSGDGMSMFCIQRLEQEAQRGAERDAELQCRIRNGQIQSYSGSCFSHCGPPIIGNQSAFVSCQAQCRFNCNIME